jgi:opacity protein-like surface antigen
MGLRIAAAMAVVCVVMVPARARAQTSLSGFGALPVDHLSSLGESGVPIDFGGGVTFDVAPGVQLLGEFGRLGNVMPRFIDAGLAFTRIDVTMAAFYGEGGVRLLAAPHSAVTPYGEATAGVAHIDIGTRGLGTVPDALLRAGLNLVDTRDPLFGAGGGVLMQSGPLRIDVGYRYKRIMANSGVTSLLSAGQRLESHQVRFGVGVRF